jgi:sphinganine-1-phosphate aldolase
MEKSLAPPKTLPRHARLPQNGLTPDALKELLNECAQFMSDRMTFFRYKKIDPTEWKRGKVSGAIYHGGPALSSLIHEAYALYSHSNPLHPDLFPSVRKMEAEVVSMCLNLFRASSTGCGNITSGGTESIIMACKTYRDRALEERGIKNPEMYLSFLLIDSLIDRIVPVTAHAAFDKASHYLGIRLIHVPINTKTWQVDMKRVASLINKNTIMVGHLSSNLL